MLIPVFLYKGLQVDNNFNSLIKAFLHNRKVDLSLPDNWLNVQQANAEAMHHEPDLKSHYASGIATEKEERCVNPYDITLPENAWSIKDPKPLSWSNKETPTELFKLLKLLQRIATWTVTGIIC